MFRHIILLSIWLESRWSSLTPVVLGSTLRRGTLFGVGEMCSNYCKQHVTAVEPDALTMHLSIVLSFTGRAGYRALKQEIGSCPMI